MTDTNTDPAPGPDPRPALPFWQARSTWAAVGAILASVATLAGQPEAAAEAAELPDKVLPLIGAALALWAYGERLFGKMRLVL